MPFLATPQWPPREVTDVRGKLDELIKLVTQPYAGEPQEVRDWLARLLVVRCCGYLEQTVLETCRGFIHGRSGGPARTFGRSWLDRGRNPTPEALVLLVGRFDATWANELSDLFDADDQRLRREVAFLVDRRNKIAHGLNEGIGTVKALQLSDVSLEASDWFIARFNPGR
jgi:hypothetical protein